MRRILSVTVVFATAIGACGVETSPVSTSVSKSTASPVAPTTISEPVSSTMSFPPGSVIIGSTTDTPARTSVPSTSSIAEGPSGTKAESSNKPHGVPVLVEPADGSVNFLGLHGYGYGHFSVWWNRPEGSFEGIVEYRKCPGDCEWVVLEWWINAGLPDLPPNPMGSPLPLESGHWEWRVTAAFADGNTTTSKIWSYDLTVVPRTIVLDWPMHGEQHFTEIAGGVAQPVARYRWWAPPNMQQFEVEFFGCDVCTTVGGVEDWNGFYVNEDGLVLYGIQVGVVPHGEPVTWWVRNNHQLSESATFTAHIGSEPATTTTAANTSTTASTTTSTTPSTTSSTSP